MTRTRNMLLIVGAFALVLPACGNENSNDRIEASTPSSATAFVLNEWSITPPAAPLEAGKVRITATNNGSETHELVIVRADDAASLPTKSDGSVDEDKIPEADKPGEIPDLAAGESVTKTLDLPAGHYLAVCNLVDQMGQGNGGMGNGNTGNGSGMGNTGNGSGMSNGNTGNGSGMSNGNTGNGSGMGHVHYRLGMVTQFTVT